MKSSPARCIGIVTILFIGIFAVLTPSHSGAALYEINSLYQSISGQIGINGQDGSFFHESTTSPVDLHDYVSSWDLWAFTNNEAGAQVTSSFDGTDFSAYVSAITDHRGHSTALVDLEFTPTVVSDWRFDGIRMGPITLTDLTTGGVLLSAANGYAFHPTFQLSPSDTYELRMTIDVWGDCDYPLTTEVRASITPVPEPATVLFLGSVLAGFAGLKKKFYN
jgi:hypothetical protein